MTDELREAVKEAIQSIDAEQHVDGYATEYLNGDTDLSEWERNVIADAALSLMQPEIDRRVAEERKAQDDRIEALEDDLVEWKNQHENLLSVRQQDIAAMQAKIDTLEKELAFKNEAIRLTKGCPGKIVVRGGFYKIDCYKSKHSKQALEGSGNG